jgi:hypothetical protein
MSTLDEFFREKLATNSLTPPEGVWEKVEAGLSKKNRGLTWLRWAAALLVGTLLFGVLWMQRYDAPQLTHDKNEQMEQAPVVTKELPQTQVAGTKSQPGQEQTVTKKNHKEQVKKLVPVPREEPMQELITGNEVTQIKEEEKPFKEEVKPLIEPVPVAEQKSRAIVLTYTLDPVIAVSEQRGENPDANVAETDKKSKGLKRVIDLANEVKNSESPLGELRLKKSELFALDLKKKSTSKNQ